MARARLRLSTAAHRAPSSCTGTTSGAAGGQGVVRPATTTSIRFMMALARLELAAARRILDGGRR